MASTIEKVFLSGDVTFRCNICGKSTSKYHTVVPEDSRKKLLEKAEKDLSDCRAWTTIEMFPPEGPSSGHIVHGHVCRECAEKRTVEIFKRVPVASHNALAEKLRRMSIEVDEKLVVPRNPYDTLATGGGSRSIANVARTTSREVEIGSE